MKKTLYTYFAKLSAILALLSIWSCSDDFSSPEPVNDGDMATLSLIIPHPHMNASRADNSSLGNIGSLESDEGKINSLWILAYAADENSDDIITRLTPDGDKLTEDYSSYMVKIPAGKYNIYTVANIDGIDKNTTEDKLKSLVLAYSEETIPNPAKGLPMVCTEEMNIEIAPGETKELFIDLTFLCVKLRYTILFDNSEDGFSKNAFGDNPIKIIGVHAENISDRNALLSYDVPTDAGSFNLDMIPGYHCQYPADINRFLDLNWNTVKDTDPSANNLAAIEESELDSNKRAYQGIVYLPENRNTEKPTTLIFDAVADNGNSFQYTVELPPVTDNAVFPDKDSDNKYVDDPHKDRMLQRGHFYDIIGRITTIGNRFDIIAGIAPWTLQNVAYSLHGPYFLHVEKTSIQVTAGVETQIAYDTDAEPLTFYSPEYNGKKLFDIKTVENAGVKYISVNINPDVQAASGVNFNSYFYINAANLKKRIEVTPVSLEPYFNIDPQDIEINVGEYISSGIYGETIDINFSTNLHNVTISKPSELDSDLTVIDLEGPTVYDVSTGTNKLKFDGLNGNAFWTTEQTFTITYVASNDDKRIEKTVKIHIIPNVTDYIIHFRPGTDWKLPHIYVYQCLQLPGDMNKNASEPVGYKVGDFYYSALEYSFTGKIAFKGWKGYGGTNDNDPVSTAAGNPIQGFLIPTNASEWDPSNANFTKHYYNDMDFCADYRESLSCSKCSKTSTEYNKTWPGIQMSPEINGWWKFVLTGIATPGKALIMFNDGHGGDSNGHTNGYDGRRYPGSAQVGIPLFDYPTHEGWFDFKNGKKQFSAENPDANLEFLRIYWPNNNRTNNSYIHVWASNPGWNGTEFNTNEGAIDPETGYYYYDFVKRDTWTLNTKIHSMLYKDNSNSGEYTIDKFTDIGNRVSAITIDENRNFVNSGKPKLESDIKLASNKYRIYWKAKSTFTNATLEAVYTFDCSSAGLDNQVNYAKTGSVGEYNYFEFTPTSSGFSLKVIIKESTSSWTGQSGDILLNNNSFTNRRCTITAINSNKTFSISNGKPTNLKAAND